LLAALQAKVSAIDARRIVFDGLDVMLAMLPSWSARRREVYRLHAWLQRHGLTSVLTVKAGADAVDATGPQTLGFMQFMVDAVVVLNHRVVQGVSLRTVRIQKYRGSGFDENEAPFLIGSTGIEVAQTRTHAHARAKASRERVSSGIERLDTMLGGGFYRGASVLITGFPGTAKTTLSGAFAQAACQRGEPTLFISFDSECAEIVRNLASVGIRLDAQLKSGRLRMISARTINGSAETYLVTIKALAREHGARCLVIDPVSAWSRSGTDLSANSVVARLIEWTKSSGITLVCTRLYDTSASSPEGSEPLQISTLTDTWIHLSYVVQAGERNRGLSIIKSRGTAHSNQVRELILASRGITLADAYTAGGEVLMGTMRWEKERAVSMANEAAGVAARLRRTRLDAEVAQLEVRTKLLQSGLMAKQQEKSMLGKSALSRQAERSRSRVRMRELRSADAPRAGTR
jgi:circadian clock protein KaiC